MEEEQALPEPSPNGLAAEIIPETCPVCERLKEICEEVGEGSFCSVLMDKLKKDEINGEQFIESLMKNEKVASQFLS